MPSDNVVEIRPHEQVLLIIVQRRSLDEAATRKLADDVLAAAGQRPSVPVVLDLGAVRFAPSVALGMLVQLSKSFRLDGRRIAMVNVDPRVMGTIQITQLHTVLDIRSSLEEFTRDLSPPRAP